MTHLTLEAGNPAHGGYCVARIPDDGGSPLAGKVALVTGTLPGERVLAEVLEDRPRLVIARTVEVLSPSEHRVEHVWPLAAQTDVGGADLGHVAPAAQLRWKEAVIRDVMRRIGGPAVSQAVGEVPVREVPGGVVGWRTRVGFVVDEAGRPAMRRSGSHELVPLDSMPLAVPEIEELGLFEGRWELEPGSQVRAVAASESPPVLVTPRGVWRAPERSAGARVVERVTTEEGSFRYRVHASGFWQAHRAAPSTLVRAVLEEAHLAGGERVLELYSGAGLFTLPLADAVGPKGRVTALEGARQAVSDARENLAGHPHARVEVARVDGRRVDGLTGGFDVVVLDPPRSGAGGAVAGALLKRAAARIVYVACDPAALARDLRTLMAGYEIERVQAFDLFPSTHHVEMVATLARRK